MKKIVMLVAVIAMLITSVVGTTMEALATGYIPGSLVRIELVVDEINALVESKEEEIEEIEYYDFRIESSIGSITFKEHEEF